MAGARGSRRLPSHTRQNPPFPGLAGLASASKRIAKVDETDNGEVTATSTLAIRNVR